MVAPFLLLSLLLFALGAIIGSFLNVVIYRTVKGESWVAGRSKCESCHRQLRWFENIPLVSYILLQGRCRSCQKTISMTHPVLEFLTGALFVWWLWGSSLFFRITIHPFQYVQPLFWLCVGILLLIIFFADLLYFIIPDEVVLSLAGLTLLYRLALVLSGVMQTRDLLLTLVGTAMVTTFFFSLWYFTKGKGMGFGDVKFAVPFGLLLGWPNVLVGLLLAFIFGGIFGIGLVLSRKKTLSQAVPFGPFLVVSTFVTLVLGSSIWAWYMALMWGKCMRIFKFLFSSLVALSIVSVLTFFIGREVLLIVASSTVTESLAELREIAEDSTEYAQKCRQKGVLANANPISQLQLRFLDSRQFVTEVICTQFSLEPIVVKKKSLPILATKTPGSSGVFWGKERSGLQLEVLGRQKDVFVENEQIADSQPGNLSYGVHPVSTCDGYGYQCCQEEAYSGIGESYKKVSDCPKSCFSSCLARPIVLAFNADPFPDEKTRTLRVQSGETVTFSYVTSYTLKEKVSLTVRYGDGEHESLSTMSGTTTHQYTCSSSQCVYVAELVARSASGVGSAMTPVTQLNVLVSP